MTSFQTDYDRATEGHAGYGGRLGGDRAGREPSITSLVRDATREVTRLFRQEVELAKTETNEKVRRLASNAAVLGAGAVLAIPALTVLLIGLAVGASELLVMAGMEEPWAAWLGPVIVGVLFLAIALGMIAKGANTIKKTDVVPHKTVDSLRDTGEWARGHASNGHRAREKTA